MNFIGMAGLADPEAMQGFVDAFDLPFPNVVTVDGSLWARFGVAGQPAWVFIDDQGEAQLFPYELPDDQVRQVLDAMLAS